MQWIKFTERLPTAADAVGGKVMARGGRVAFYPDERPVDWDWIRPTHDAAAATWEANGFTDWAHIGTGGKHGQQ